MAAAAVFPVPAPAAPPRKEGRALRGGSRAGALEAAQALAGDSAGGHPAGNLAASGGAGQETAAQAQAQNAMAGVIEHAIWEQLGEEEITYSDLVTIQRDSAGTITALTTNTAAMNQLRAELIRVVLEALDGVDVSQIQIPLGSLVDLDLLWGLGPTMKVHAMTVGTVEGEFQSQFSSAGVNQTLHKIDLELAVPLTLMLPGGAVETVCETQIPIAETVIVGQVPQIFLQNGGL